MILIRWLSVLFIISTFGLGCDRATKCTDGIDKAACDQLTDCFWETRTTLPSACEDRIAAASCNDLDNHPGQCSSYQTPGYCNYNEASNKCRVAGGGPPAGGGGPPGGGGGPAVIGGGGPAVIGGGGPAVIGGGGPAVLPSRVVIFDAGSTGTRVSIFNVAPAAALGGIPDITLGRDPPGIGGGAGAPWMQKTLVAAGPITAPATMAAIAAGGNAAKAAVQAHLQQLKNFADSKILLADRAHTPVYFQATQGARSLPPAQQAQLIAAVRAAFADAAFSSYQVPLPSARLGEPINVVPGPWEGVYTWIAVNYLKGTFVPPHGGGPPPAPYGIVEMGGASLQITFKPGAAPTSHSYNVRLGSTDYNNLYSYSYDTLGAKSAWNNYAANDNCRRSPPHNNNPSFFSCRTHILSGIYPPACPHASCGLLNTYQPQPLAGRFVALGGFFNYTSNNVRTGVAGYPVHYAGPHHLLTRMRTYAATICPGAVAAGVAPAGPAQYEHEACFNTTLLNAVLFGNGGAIQGLGFLPINNAGDLEIIENLTPAAGVPGGAPIELNWTYGVVIREMDGIVNP